MFKSSKSVDFEEYRDCSWQDACKGMYDNYHDQNKLTNDMPRFQNKTKYGTGTSFSDMAQLPPPLEPRDRIVQCIDPATADISVISNWWDQGGKIKEHARNPSSTPLMPTQQNSIGRISNNSYIMPSSLAPAYNTFSTFIPPPTAYRDENGKTTENNAYQSYYQYFSHFDEDNGHDENTGSVCDIIEIKRPGTVCFHRNESDYGLVHPCKAGSQHEPDRNAVDSSNQFWDTTSSNCASNQQAPQRRIHSRCGIFNLPEIYSPPPLSELTSQQVSTDSSSQVQRLMPSFLNPSGQYAFHGCQMKASPRIAFSEPILKTDREKAAFSQNTIRPETTRVSPRVRNKTFFEATTSDCETKRSNNGGSSSIVKAPVGQKLSIYCGAGDRRLVAHEHAQPKNETNFSDADVNRGRQKHDGSGDYNEFSNHNCLSPRARISRIQPSVITPEVTESLLGECLANLRSGHWEDNFDSLSQIYNLTELHPGRVKSILNKIIWFGLPHLSSPRTKLARMACICFKRLYQTQKRSMETEGEKVFYRLLDLCGGLANNFIQQESREALVAAVENMDPLKSLSFLELHGAKHKNPHVREFSAYLLSAIMDELPQNKLMNKEFSPRIIPMIVSFLREGLLQTRLHAKLALDKIFDHPTFESKLRRYVSPENVRHIADTLREFRERRSGHI